MRTHTSNPIQPSTQLLAALRRRKFWISLGVVLSFLLAAYLAIETWLGSQGMDIQFTREGR